MAEKKTEICAEQIKTDEKYMREAIRQAKKAWKLDETPIGCVIVHEGRIIGRGYNRRNTDKSPLGDPEGQQKDRRLAPGRVHPLCDAGALPDVRGSHHTVTDPESGGGLYESESRMCGVCPKPVGCESI